jgi:hypothetical protein
MVVTFRRVIIYVDRPASRSGTDPRTLPYSMFFFSFFSARVVLQLQALLGMQKCHVSSLESSPVAKGGPR